MKHWSFCLVALSLASGCSDFEGLAVTGNIIQDEDNCTVDPSSSSTLLLGGLFNVDYPDGYEFYPRIESQVRNLTADTRADPSPIQGESAEVSIEVVSGDGSSLPTGDGVNPFVTPAAFTVPSATASGQTVTAGLATSVITVIPDAFRPFLPREGTVVVHIRLEGETFGGKNIDSKEFSYPINLCSGSCLFTCLPATDLDSDEEFACNPGQDKTSRVRCLTDPDTGITQPRFLFTDEEIERILSGS